MRLIVSLDIKATKIKLHDDDIILTNDYSFYMELNRKYKIMLVDRTVCLNDNKLTESIQEYFTEFKEEMNLLMNNSFLSIFHPIYSIIKQIEIIIGNEKIDELVLIGGSEYKFLTSIHGEGEGVKKSYKSNWLLNSIIREYFVSEIKINWMLKKSCRLFAVFNELREKIFFWKTIMLKLISILKHHRSRLPRINDINAKTKLVCVVNVPLQYRHLKSLVNNFKNVDTIFISAFSVPNSTYKNIVRRTSASISEMFSIIKDVNRNYYNKNVEFHIYNKKIIIQQKHFSRAFKVKHFEFLIDCLEIRKSIELLALPQKTIVLTNMTFGTDIIACKNSANKLNIQHYNFQYVSMDKIIFPNPELADRYYLYAKSVYDNIKSYSSSYKLYFPIRKLPDIVNCKIGDIINVALFTQPDRFTIRYLILIEKLIKELSSQNIKINLTIKLHQRQDQVDKFYDFEKYSFVDVIFDSSVSCEDIIMKSDICISMTSSVIFEALMLGRFSIIANIDGLNQEQIYNNDIVFPDINFVANSIEEIMSIINNKNHYQQEFVRRLNEYIANNNCSINYEEILNDI